MKNLTFCRNCPNCEYNAHEYCLIGGCSLLGKDMTVEDIIKEYNLPKLEVGKIYNLFDELWDGEGEFPLSKGSYGYQCDEVFINYVFKVANYFPCGEENDMEERCSYCQYADGHGVCQMARTHPTSKEEWEILIVDIEII